MNSQARVSRARRPLAALLAVALAGLGAPTARAQDVEAGPQVSLRLQDCLAMALDHNLDVAVQRYDIQVSGTEEDTAYAAFESLLSTSFTEFEQVSQNVNPFAGPPETSIRGRSLTSTWNDPTVWGGEFQVQFQSAYTRANFFLLDPTWETAVNMRYEQSLLRRFGVDVNEAPIEIAQNTTRISQAQFRDTVMSTVQATEFAYWDLVFARMDLQVKRQSLDLAGELLQMNRAKVEVGTMAPIDVTQAEAGVASREEAVIVAEARVGNAEDTLRKLLNPPADSPIWHSEIIPADTPSFEPLSPDTASALDSARLNRPELDQQRLAIKNFELQERIDRAASRWDLTASASYNMEGLGGSGTVPADTDGDGTIDGFRDFDESYGNALSDLDITDDERRNFADWAIGLQLDIPIGNRAAKARHAATTLRQQQAEVQMQNLLLTADIDVRTKVRDVNTNIKRVEAARKNRELQQKNVEAEQKKFDNGMSTSFTVLQIQEDLATAESQENLAIIDYNKSLVSLEKAKGTLIEARQIRVAVPADQAGT